MAGTGTQVAAAPAAQPAAPGRPAKAYQLTDAQGHQALVWWGPDGSAVVEAEDAAFRRRLRRALRRPLWTTEDALGPDGAWSSYPVQLQPTDRRYPIRLRWAWGQVGLEDVIVRVVSLTDPAPELSPAPGPGLPQPQAQRP